MFFSIIIPIYNTEMYLDRCVESVIQQDIGDYEIILIEDCGTDHSCDIAKKWEQQYDNIVFIQKSSNTGLADVRNIGIQKAKGKYVLFLDSDDYFSTNSLRQFVTEIADKNDPDVIYMGYILEKDHVHKKKYSYLNYFEEAVEAHFFIKEELKERNLPIAACFAAYKREFILENMLLFQQGILHEDEEWSPRILYEAGMVATSRLAFYHYVIRENSITTMRDKTKNGLDLLNTCYKLISYSEKIEDKELKKLFRNRVAMLYMKAMCIGRLFQKDTKKKIHRGFPFIYACKTKDIMKSILFFLNLKLYYCIDKLNAK